MNRKAIFVTGTDTGIGKTQVAVALTRLANRQGCSTAVIKPLSAGCETIDGELCNDDAVLLQKEASLPMEYCEVNPVALKAAIAPHLAAKLENRTVDGKRLAGFCRGVLSKGADLTVLEGAGGWRVPLNERELYSSLVKELQLPVLMVVGIRLGCLNHALMTAEAIRNDGLLLAGWVANCVEPDMHAQQGNIQTLHSMLAAPCVGQIPFLDDPNIETVSSFLDLPLLMKRIQS